MELDENNKVLFATSPVAKTLKQSHDLISFYILLLYPSGK